MPRAAPGVSARRAARRIHPGFIRLPDLDWYRHLVQVCTRQRTEAYLRPIVGQFLWLFCFTLCLFTGEVKRGRLGEVESSVGDCRPPPPGNPRQPSSPLAAFAWGGWWHKNPVLSWTGFLVLCKNRLRTRGFLSRVWSLYSFNNPQIDINLKKLKIAQYFKNIGSYSSCAVKCPMLEFCTLHYQIYGLWVVEPPSIAMTYVLGT